MGISTITFSEIKKKRAFAMLKYLFKKKNMLQVLLRLFLAMIFLNHNTYIPTYYKKDRTIIKKECLSFYKKEYNNSIISNGMLCCFHRTELFMCYDFFSHRTKRIFLKEKMNHEFV